MTVALTTGSRESRWRPRPVASWSIRVAVFIVPVSLGFLTSLLVTRVLPRPADLATELLWWSVLIAAVLAVVVAATAGCRRFLPLAALLDLSLLFPDKAPSRFALARQTGSAKHLAQQLAAVRDAEGAAESPAVWRAERILSLVASLSVHDARTRGHSERVRVYTDMLSDQLGLPEEDRDRLRWASMLHDIGKLVVPPELLNKPGGLDEGEWEVIHRHPAEGARILAPLKSWLGEWADAAEHHHEWWDGSGYPRGLKREEISRAGRMVAVTDAYETMTSARPYQRTLTPLAARRELVAHSGTQFDPRIVRAFLEISVGRLWRAVGLEALIAEIPLLAPVVWLTGRAAGWSGPAAATAGTVAILVAGGWIGPLSSHPATRGIARQVSAAPSAPAAGTVATAPAGAVAPNAGIPAATAAAPAQKTRVEAATTSTPNSPAPTPIPAPPPAPGGGSAPTHGASAFTPGHGYEAPPGQGGVPPGHVT